MSFTDSGIIVAVSVCILGLIVVVLPKVFRKISYQQEVRKTEKAIENAFDSITNVEEFTCHIEATAQLYTTANGNQVNDGITVQSDTTFKGDKVHAENGRYYSLMSTQTDIGHIEDFPFEFYVTENNLAYSKKDEGSFERVNANFSRDDMLEFFDEVIENYNEEPRYSSGDVEGTVKISGTLSDGIEIYNTYIDFLVLSGAEPEDYLISDTMNYNVIISKESETVQSISFYLSDVEHIWLGWGDDGLQVDNAYGDLTIEFQAFEDIADFDLPSVAEEAEQAFESMPEWKRTYLNQLDMSQVWYPSLVDLNGDGAPEIVACADEDGQYMSWCIYYIDKTNTIQQIDITYSSFNYGAGKIYSSGGHTGVYWDTVYAYNPSTGVYDLVFDGVWYDNFDGDGNYIPVYQISGADVSEEEYNQKLNDITADITNSYSGDENFSQDTDVTDLIMEYDSIKSISDMESFDDEANIPYTETTYNTYEYCIYQFEQKDGILTVAADDGAAVADGFGLQDSFSFSYPIAEDCTWESGHWDDGFVPYEQIDMETVMQGIKEWRDDYELFPDELESPAEICFDIVNNNTTLQVF